MEANSLRIGNNVRYQHGPIINLGIHDLYRFNYKYIHLKPIILDEIKLIQLGFNKIDKYTFVSNSIFIYHRKRGFIYGSRNREVNIKYVHELQNLYFALKGNDIQLNLDV